MADVSPHTDDGLIASQNHERYVRARDSGHRAFLDDDIKCNDFYSGDQWSPTDLEKLTAARRPAMTINLTMPTINTLVGELISQQADFAFKPKRGAASEAVAADLTKVVMHITEANNYEALEHEVVEDAAIGGRGYFDVRVDFDDNVLGEARISVLSPREVVLDPTAREYDPATWNEVYTTRWLSVDELVAIYGKTAGERLTFAASAGTLINNDSLQWEERQTFGNEPAFVIGAIDDVETGRTLKNVRVVERQYYRLDSVREFVDPVQGDTRPVPETWDDAKIQLYMQVKGLQMRTRLTRKVRWTVSADCVLLKDTWSPYKTFTVVPYFFYFRRGKPFGVVKNLISPQEIVNKTESQLLHVVNTTANSGYIVDVGALANMTVEELEQKGAETGIVIERNIGREIEKIQPNQVPTGLDRVGTRAALSFQLISGVNDAMMGNASDEVSGVALENRQARGSIPLGGPRARLALTRKFVARKILELVQLFYTEARVLRLTSHDGTTDEVAINQQDTSGAIVNDLTLGEYDVVVGSMPARDTYDDVQFAEVIQLREAGVVIPDHRVIQYSNLARKHEIAEEVKQLTGFGEPTPEQQAMQQAQMQLLMAEVEQAMADVEKTKADAALSTAKAQTEVQQPQLEREQMQADMATTATEQTTRMQVQRLKELSAQLQAALSANTKMRVEAHKVENKPKPPVREPSSGTKRR